MPSDLPPADTPAVGSIGRRRPRLSDVETERRMLQTAAKALTEAGLTVSLEHVRMEDVIREAGVSRSAVYRRWPHKDMFLGDLLLELAGSVHEATQAGHDVGNEAVRRVLLGRFDELRTPEGRRQLVVDLASEAALADFLEDQYSNQWRTYLALTMTLVSLPEGKLRDDLRASLAASEQALTERVAYNYSVIAGLLGLRPRPDSGTTFATIARLGKAVMIGLIIESFATPDVTAERVRGELFGQQGAWSLPALGVTSLTLTFLEPDPDVEWDDARLAQLRERLEAGDDLFAPPS